MENLERKLFDVNRFSPTVVKATSDLFVLSELTRLKSRVLYCDATKPRSVNFQKGNFSDRAAKGQLEKYQRGDEGKKSPGHELMMRYDWETGAKILHHHKLKSWSSFFLFFFLSERNVSLCPKRHVASERWEKDEQECTNPKPKLSADAGAHQFSASRLINEFIWTQPRPYQQAHIDMHKQKHKAQMEITLRLEVFFRMPPQGKGKRQNLAQPEKGMEQIKRKK